ncbi:MAG: hypothetical protein AAGD28_28240 [Bacteroidota bacterium]
MNDQNKNPFQKIFQEGIQNVEADAWKEEVLNKLKLAEELSPRIPSFWQSNFFYPILGYSFLLLLFWGMKPILDGSKEESLLILLEEILMSPTAISLIVSCGILSGIDKYLKRRKIKKG